MRRMLVVTRYRVPEHEAADFRVRAQAAVEALAARPGHVSTRLGRATDDAQLWVLASEWESVGTYRRALSGYEVKLHAIPLLSLAIDEPSAFETLDAWGSDGGSDEGSGVTRLAADAGTVGVGEASAPRVRTDLD